MVIVAGLSHEQDSNESDIAILHMIKLSQPKKRRWSFKQLLRRRRAAGKRLPDILSPIQETGNSRYLREHTGGWSLLPHEIVGDILSMIVHDHFSLHSLHRTDGKAYTWFSQVLHVCRYLRSVALDCSAIWSYIDTSWHHLVGELLRRSRSAPLTVIVQLNENEDPTTTDNKAIYLVLEEVHRIKSLQFHGTALHSNLLRLILPIEAPCLENLVMTSRSISELPKMFFVNPASSKGMHLKRLFVFNMQVPTEPYVLSNLQRLKINRARILQFIPNMSSVSQIVGILSQCQNLIDFEYNDYDDLHMPVDDSETRITPVALPHLRRIHLTLNANSSVCVLRHLVVAPGISVFISGQFLLNHDPPISPNYLLGCKYIKAKVRRSFLIVPETEMCDMHLDFHPRTWSWQFIFRALTQLFVAVLSQIQTFELDGCDFLYTARTPSSETWIQLLSSFPSLECLRLTCALPYVAEGLTDALRETNSGQLICPTLRKLVLDIRGSEFTPEPLWEKMVLSLRSRDELHFRLETLDLSACKHSELDTERVLDLAPLVDTLILPSS